MLRLLSYLLNQGVVTTKEYCPPLAEGALGLPKITTELCLGSECGECEALCPTQAIDIEETSSGTKVSLDLGACIACRLCTNTCPTATLINCTDTRVATTTREALCITSPNRKLSDSGSRTSNAFKRSIAARVVSTGCSACDLEISACSNPIFDMERFGIQIVASPRFADVLLVTGPVPKAMHEPLVRCFQAMPQPRLVVAVGTCAISGGVHKGGYTEANGVGSILPVDVFIPGCPPHPWSIIDGIRLAMEG